MQRHRRERKQTEFYNPAELEDATSLHRADSHDSPAAGGGGPAGGRGGSSSGGKAAAGRGGDDGGVLGCVGKARGGAAGGQGVPGDAELTPCGGCSNYNRGLAHCFAQVRMCVCKCMGRYRES